MAHEKIVSLHLRYQLLDFDMLQKATVKSLEYLEAFYDVSYDDDTIPDHFGPLRSLARPKRLDTQLEILLDAKTEK
ncbi:hypothetical protein BDV10DRAFT_57289 [Aspergillus recurvatus]